MGAWSTTIRPGRLISTGYKTVKVGIEGDRKKGENCITNKQLIFNLTTALFTAVINAQNISYSGFLVIGGAIIWSAC